MKRFILLMVLAMMMAGCGDLTGQSQVIPTATRYLPSLEDITQNCHTEIVEFVDGKAQIELEDSRMVFTDDEAVTMETSKYMGGVFVIFQGGQARPVPSLNDVQYLKYSPLEPGIYTIAFSKDVKVDNENMTIYDVFPNKTINQKINISFCKVE